MLQPYLISGLALLFISLALLGFGIPYNLAHHPCPPFAYGCEAVNPLTGGQGRNPWDYDPILGQTTFYGILVLIVACLLLMVHVFGRKEAKKQVKG